MNIDEMIAKALEEEFEERVEHNSDDTKKHRFSLAYRLWERKMLRNPHRGSSNHRTLKHTKMVIASGFAALAILIGGVAFAAVNTGRYKFNDMREYSKMLIENHPSDKTDFEEFYGLSEDDGWLLVKNDRFYAFTWLNYECGDKKVNFSQRIIHEGNMENINTEKADIEMVSLYTENDGFILSFHEDWCIIYWIYDGYLLEADGNLNKKEMIDLAYSIKIINLPKNS